ncbi:hypothetical protein GCM10027036_04050 [Flavihumibacter cheonanensis]|uniref:hypothetical protein n=1 Tax=Flavihumibacter TaxID=1004301 RepID=UPI001EF87643|nr:MULTISPECIES: hypothetical protein [Flavihumibacter]MCG7752151.1 hypothetical protein [Flavihumibacter cheonanensis]
MQAYMPGKFEFLITGDNELSSEQFNTLLFPTTYQVKKIERDGWSYFQTEGDEFSYSWEPPGIQMTFNKECSFQKAKQIADEVVQNLVKAGFNVELLVINNTQITTFQ